jgi:hypothetical protein
MDETYGEKYEEKSPSHGSSRMKGLRAAESIRLTL